MGRIGTILVGGLVAVSRPAWAGESLINGEQLQYNFAYRCNGERVIVARCRDNDDQSYCQIVYPDRPEQNGNQVAPVEMRGDIVAKLDACARPKTATVASSGTAAPAAIKARAPTSPPPAPAAAPGLGNAKWSMLDMDPDFATYFAAGGVKRTGTSGSGWFTTVYSEPQSYPSANISGVVFIQGHYQADCTKHMIKAPELAAYDDDGKVLVSGPDPNASWEKVEADSTGQRKLNILCGKPQLLLSKAPITGDHHDIEMHYLTEMVEAAHAQQMKAGQKPH